MPGPSCGRESYVWHAQPALLRTLFMSRWNIPSVPRLPQSTYHHSFKPGAPHPMCVHHLSSPLTRCPAMLWLSVFLEPVSCSWVTADPQWAGPMSKKYPFLVLSHRDIWVACFLQHNLAHPDSCRELNRFFTAGLLTPSKTLLCGVNLPGGDETYCFPGLDAQHALNWSIYGGLDSRSKEDKWMHGCSCFSS